MKPDNIHYFNALNIILAIFTIAILGCIFIVPFLVIDHYFNFSFQFSTEAFWGVWNDALFSALSHSISVSLLASTFAVILGTILSKLLIEEPLYYFLPIILTYSINPVLRALTYFNLFNFYTPLTEWSGFLFGPAFSSNIFLPALILALHYLPLYLMRNFFILPKKDETRRYPPLLQFLFSDFPSWLLGLPISFTLFFLMSFFDYWVIQVISGNTILYWTPLFVEKAFQAREVSEASFMILIGLFVTLLVYLGVLLITKFILYLYRFLSPLRFQNLTNLTFNNSLLRLFTKTIYFLATILIFFPVLGSLIEFFRSFFIHSTNWSLMTGTFRGLFSGFSLAVLVGLISATISLIVSVFYEERPWANRSWRSFYYILALAPEAAFVLLSFFVTGSGLLSANFFWLLILILSFSIPIAFFLWESLWSEAEKLKLWVLGKGAHQNLLTNTKLALLEWQRYWGIVFLIIFWMTNDNVFTTNFASSPKWRPFSAAIFNATKRGFSSDELLASLLGAILTFGFIMLGLYYLNKLSSFSSSVLKDKAQT